MAVESFIPIDDAKIVIEKESKPLPSIDERTKIERPGIAPATSLLKSEKSSSQKKNPRLKKAKARPEKISQPIKDSILIITEKPQSAQKIASALGSPSKYSEDGVYFFELERNNKKILVASAVGHLFNLNYKAGQKGWPVFELEWRSLIRKTFFGLYKKILQYPASFSKKSRRNYYCNRLRH